MSIYASQGTIKVRCSIRCEGGQSVSKTTVYFVPDKDYSIKHGHKSYAAFVPLSCGCSDQSCGCSGQSCGCSDQSCCGQSCGCSGQSCGCSGHSSGCKSHACKNGIIRKYNPCEGVAIALSAAGKDCVNTLSTAAMKRIKVQVEVKATLKKKAKKKNKSKQCLKLVGITIPAK